MAQKKTVGPSQASCREIAESIDDDLRSLHRIITRLFEIETSDEVRAHILNAKVAADRGLVLTKRLLEITDGQTVGAKAH